jgi:hypothetical protein
MMANRFDARLLIGVLLAVAAAAGIGVTAYNAGVAHGLAQGAAAAGTAGAAAPYVYGWRPWGFGFGFFPFFFLLLWFFALRGLFWRGWRGGWGPGDGGVPPRFEEWHRRAHERDAARPATGATN